jgi:hypothetical protein
MYAWYKDGVKLTIDGVHYEKDAYWGGGIGLKIHNVTSADAGMYECRCILDGMPFASGKVDLDVAASAGWVYDVALTGIRERYVGDLPTALSTIRTNDIRVGVTDIQWANLDAGGHITADSYYTITVEAQYGATFDEQMTWDMDGVYMDYALVSDDGKTAQLVDTHKYEGRGDYAEEDDKVILAKTAYTLYQGFYCPMTDQFDVYEHICPKTHTSVLGEEHEVGKVIFLGSGVPDGLRFEHNGLTGRDYFCGVVRAEPGVYKTTVRYPIVDVHTKEVHNYCDVEITFTVLSGEGMTSGELEHMHAFGDWTSDGPDTHSSSCAGCGENVSYPHNWDEGVVTKTPTKNSDGTMVYTCATCGQTRTETLDYTDYMPPFPEVEDVIVSEADNEVTVELEEYSGYAENVTLFVAAYDASGRIIDTAMTSPDKIGEVTVSLSLARAVKISVFVIDSDSGMIPLTPLYTLDL